MWPKRRPLPAEFLPVVPGYLRTWKLDEARRDGQVAHPIQRGTAAIKTAYSEELKEKVGRLEVARDHAKQDLASLHAGEEIRLNRVAEVGDPVDHFLLSLLYLAGVVFCADGEARMLERLAAIFASGSTEGGYLAGLLLATVGSGLLKIAISKSKLWKAASSHPSVGWILVAFCLPLVVSAAILRPRFMNTVEAAAGGNELLGKVLSENAGLFAAVFLTYGLCLWVFSALALERVFQVVEAHTARYLYRETRKKREGVERFIATVESAIRVAPEVFDKAEAHTTAEYIYEYELGRILGKESPSPGTFDKFLKVALTTAGGLLAGGITSMVAWTFGGSVLLASAVGCGVAVSTVLGLAALSRLGLLTLVLCAAVLIQGCSGPKKPALTKVVLVADVSDSVRVPDEKLIGAALSLITKLPYCSDVIILPRNAAAGESYKFRIPCEKVVFDSDRKNALAAAKRELPKRFVQWRRDGNLSDYRGTFQHAASALKFGGKRVLIVLGDMVDDREGKRRAGLTVPSLPQEGLRGVAVYLGWTPSSELSSLPDAAVQKFQDDWAEALKRVGAKPFVDPAGLQGLEPTMEFLFGTEVGQ